MVGIGELAAVVEGDGMVVGAEVSIASIEGGLIGSGDSSFGGLGWSGRPSIGGGADIGTVSWKIC